MNKKIDKIGLIILVLVILIFSVLIGANEKGFRIVPTTVLLSLEFLYLVLKKIISKEKIVVKNKFDLFVLLFFLTPILPFIFKTYISLQGTAEFIFKYIFIYTTYLCVRNCVKDKKDIFVIFYSILLGSLFIYFVSIDMMHSNILKSIYNKFNLVYLNINHLSGPFGYKNTFAIYFLACLFISIYLFKNTNRKLIKLSSIIYIVFAFFCVIFSSSRLVILLMLGSLFIYFAINNINIIKKYYKKTLLIIVILLVSVLSIFFVFCNKSDSIKINGSKEFELSYNFKSNTEYTISFYTNKTERFNVVLTETLSNFDKVKTRYIVRTKKVDENKYKYTIDYKTGLKPYKIDVLIKNASNVEINNLYINDKEEILKYKYIPYKISQFIKSINLKDYSNYQRLIYWKDCLKMSKKSPIFGLGGDTWKTESYVVQDINYNIKESHSYLFELLISFGIIGLVLFTLMIVYFNIIVIKRHNKKILPLLFAIDLIILHSYFYDFNMSFVLIQLIVYSLIGIIINLSNLDEIKSKKNYVDYVYIFGMIVAIAILCIENIYRKYDFSYFNRSYRKIYVSNLIKTNEDPKVVLSEIQKYMKTEPYYFQLTMYNNYLEQLSKGSKKMSRDEFLGYLKFLNNQNNKYPFRTKYSYQNALYKVQLFADFYLTLNNIDNDDKEFKDEIKKLGDHTLEEVNKNLKLIKNDKYANKEMKDNIINSYNNILDKLK